MKLKKIASLVLAGIMAVSMLAACGSTPVEEDPSSSETPATGVSATFASYLKNGKRVTFEDNAEYAGYLADGIKKADPKHDTLDNAKKVEAIEKTYDVYKDVDSILSRSVIGYNNNNTIDKFGSSASDKTDTTYVAMYRAPGNVKQNVVLKEVAADLDDNLTDAILVNYSTEGDARYDYKYTGSVSMQKVEDGSSSAWYILVTLDFDVTKVDQK